MTLCTFIVTETIPDPNLFIFYLCISLAIFNGGNLIPEVWYAFWAWFGNDSLLIHPPHMISSSLHHHHHPTDLYPLPKLKCGMLFELGLAIIVYFIHPPHMISSSLYHRHPTDLYPWIGQKHLLFLLLFVVVFVVAVCDFLRQLSEQVGAVWFRWWSVWAGFFYSPCPCSPHSGGCVWPEETLSLCPRECAPLWTHGASGTERSGDRNKHVHRYVKQNQVNRNNVGVYGCVSCR